MFLLKELDLSFEKSKKLFNKFLVLGTSVFLIGHLFRFGKLANFNYNLFLPFFAIFIVYLLEDLMGLDKDNPDNLKTYLKMFLTVYSVVFILSNFSFMLLGFYILALIGFIFWAFTPFYLADGFSFKESLNNSYLAVKEYELFLNLAVIALSILIMYFVFTFQLYVIAVGMIFVSGITGFILDVAVFALFSFVQFRVLAWVLEYLREQYELTNDVIL
jgi:hypothetical protein